MASFRAMLSSGLVLALVLTTFPAEARFGKSSSSSNSQQGESKVHDATAVGEDSDDDGSDDSSSSSGGSDQVSSDVTVSDVSAMVDLFSFIFTVGNHRTPLATEFASDGQVHGQRHAASMSFRTGIQGGPMNDDSGSNVDFFLGLEGYRFGVDGMLTGLALDADDGSSGTDSISLLEAHLTWALVVQPRARLRIEAGLSSASAPEASWVGFSMAASGEACLLGPLDFEARMQITPFPYRQFDASAALALHLGGLVLRGGYRGLVLDDAGLLDGVAHRDVLGGPFAGLGLTF
ncbi:hypothetical protein [Hyalangium versicolor]|uniref:hypothetical protein n=1 Tax=Hyalangium versicolor TaxID=2861190 RepID=UPI001CCBD4CD|nr:hypothetical protein [Hyalangium versicolor]